MQDIIKRDLESIEDRKVASVMQIAGSVSEEVFCKSLETTLITKMGLIVENLKSSCNSDILKKYNGIYAYYNILSKLLGMIYGKTTSKTTRILNYRGKTFSMFSEYFTFIWFNHVLLPLHTTFSKRFAELIENTYKDNITNMPSAALEYAKHIEFMIVYGGLEFYNDFISYPYVEIIKRYYELFAQQEIAKCTVEEYINKVIPIINSEADKATKYFKHEVRGYVLNACKDFFIIRYIDVIGEEFIRLVKTENLVLLKSLYDVLTMLQINISSIQADAISYIRKHCHECIQQSDNNSDYGYIDTIIRLYDKYINMYHKCFGGDNVAQCAISNLMSEIINKNHFIKDDKEASTHLVKTFDMFLKKAESDDDKERLKDFNKIFRYVMDKEAFAIYYKNTLAKRLLKISNSAGDAIELENYSLDLMKQIQGHDYIQKMQRMILDLLASKSLIEKFGGTAACKGLKSKFYINLLTSGIWPLRPSFEFSVPKELTDCMRAFTTYYDIENARRKLSWDLQLSHGELSFKSDKGNNYKLIVSTQQIAILMRFDVSNVQTIEDLHKFTNIPIEYLEANMTILTASKLIKDAGDNKYVLNTSFNNKATSITLNKPINLDKVKEKDANDKEVEESRNFALQAVIVRIMKTKKTLKHQDLIAETIKQISARFQPKIPSIKKQIDLLIEKEYLRRVEDSKDEYEYLA
jgi:cullin 1